MENCWIYEGKCLETPPEGFYGFIYHIEDDLGRHYWGKKAFFHTRKKKITKKIIKETKTRKRIERVQEDSQWLDYWGSSKELIAYIQEIESTQFFKRKIVKLCKNKQSLSFWEMKILMDNNVLFRDDCYNGNIGGKFFKGKIHE